MKIKMISWVDKKPPDKDSRLISPEDCKCHVLPFDEEAAKTMTASEVRVRYPRFFGRCSSCGYYGIAYSSFAHYIYGDW